MGRKFLVVDQLPQGVDPRYEKDVSAVAVTLGKRQGVPSLIIEGEEFYVPTFEIAVYPQVRIAEIKQRRFYVVDRAQMKAKEAVQKEEDINIFRCLAAAVEPAQTVLASGTAGLTLDALNDAFVAIEEHDLVVSRIAMHARDYGYVRTWGLDVFDEATQRDVLMTGLYGHLFTADIHLSSQIDPGVVLLAAHRDFTGVLCVRTDISVMPADLPQHLRLGWVIFEEIGIAIPNSYAVSAVNVSATSSY